MIGSTFSKIALISSLSNSCLRNSCLGKTVAATGCFAFDSNKALSSKSLRSTAPKCDGTPSKTVPFCVHPAWSVDPMSTSSILQFRLSLGYLRHSKDRKWQFHDRRIAKQWHSLRRLVVERDFR